MKPNKINWQPVGCWLLVALLTCAAFAQGHGFTIQLASLTSEAEARALINELQARRVESYLVKATVPGKGTRYRVRIGRFATSVEAKNAGDRLLKRGDVEQFVVMPYEPPAITSNKKEAAPATVAPALSGKEPRQTIAPASAVANEIKQNNDSAPQNKTKDDGKDAVSSASAEIATKPPETSKQVSAAAGNAEKSLAPPAPLLVTSTAKPSDVAPLSSYDTADKLKHDTPTKTEPKIAAPPVADALADFSFSNHHWQVVRRSAETDKSLRAIHFVDELTGWVAGDAGALYRTTDGGRTWKPLLSGAAADINFIQFIDWNYGWMLGAVGDEAGDGNTVLLSTNNGGRTWTRQALPDVLGIHFTDAKNGWAVGRNATVLRTGNGGADWQPIAGLEKLIGLPIESANYSYGFRDIFFLSTERGQSGQRGWMIGNFYGRDGNHIGGLFATTDGGQTWRRIPFTLQTQYASGRFTPGLLHSVRFSDAQTGSVTGEMMDGEGRFFFVLHTRDGGQTWEQFRTPSRAAHSTQFLNLSSGWMAATAPREGAAEAVVYDTTLLRTDNGGMSWQSDFTARGRRIHSLFFLSPTKGWAVGDRGTILRYEDKKSQAPD
jgi:photosystem II stability/assembly factor-like uncharacterized protein